MVVAIYRNVQLSFWTDRKVEEEFTPEDKYFYLYLFTNPHTNLCGCYELGMRQASRETGYSEDTIIRLIERFETFHGVIRYSKETKEVLLLNWHKYNWTKSQDFKKGLEKQITEVKDAEFKRFLTDLSNGIKTVPRPSTDGGGTTVTDTVLNNNIVSNYPSIDTKEDIKDGNGSKKDVDFEELWEYTFKCYKKPTSYASAKQAWLDKIISTPEDNRFDVAKLIYKATLAYIADYEAKNPNDKDYRYIPKYATWLTEDCDYWISVVEKGGRE